MTFTGFIGAACMLPLRAIIAICVKLKIHPNTLTFIGVLINIAAAVALALRRYVLAGFVMIVAGISATIEEWLLSAEYLLAGGNMEVVLCERGIRTFETYTRNTLDLNAVPVVKELSHLPVIVDPSHGTGIRDKVAPMARAAIAAGADGLIVEVHHDPDRALSDGAQSLRPGQFDELVRQIRTIAEVLGRRV